MSSGRAPDLYPVVENCLFWASAQIRAVADRAVAHIAAAKGFSGARVGKIVELELYLGF